MSYLIFVYLAYASVSIGLTVWLARTLFQNGAIFLRDVFADQPEMAAAVNRLLVEGFYLLNLGYACFLLKAPAATTAVAAIEVLSSKMGSLLLSLAFAHFFNLYLFHRIRRRARELPPVPPTYRLEPSR